MTAPSVYLEAARLREAKAQKSLRCIAHGLRYGKGSSATRHLGRRPPVGDTEEYRLSQPVHALAVYDGWTEDGHAEESERRSALPAPASRTEPLRPSRAAPAPGSPEQCFSEEDVASLLAPVPNALETELSLRHLARCSDCRELVLLACVALADAPGKRGARAGFCLMFEPGSIVARRYFVQRLLGRGGMGEVYEAFDLLLRERVALKAVRASACDDPRALSRLIAEVRGARAVRHPNVCRTHDLGVDAGANEREPAVLFFTMELVSGVSLRQELGRRGALGIPASLALGRDVLSGLAAIHATGIVHRDIKSDNVMLSPAGSAEQRAIIVDFGLARDQGPRARPRPAEETGVGPSGSVAYMAPEQVRGEPAGPGADMFSAGVVLFEAITGRLPFTIGTPARINFLSRQSGLAVLRLRDVLPEAPAGLDAFLARCLCDDPQQRFGSGADGLCELIPLCGA
jgi:tRNA A-37 threonylcarbamoyl transferase component Bud32